MSRSLQRALQVASDRIVKQEDQIQRALQVLQNLDRYNVEPCSRMEWRKDGDWVDFCSVSKAIQILQEGQQ